MTDKLFYKATTGILFLSLGLTSCGSLVQSPTDYGNTPAERRLREESKLFNSSSVEACLLLGGLAGIIFYAANRDPDQALMAAAAGCGIGVGANYYVQTRRSQYRNNEQRLRSMIADLRTDNARLRRLIAASKEVIGADLRKIAAIDKAYREKRISLARARAEMRSVNKNQAHFSRTLANLKERERRWLRVAQDERRYNPRSRGIAAMDREINTLQSQIAVMERELDILAQRRIVSPAG